MEQNTTILIFIGVALGILALAFFLSRVYKKSIKREKHQYDINGDGVDGKRHAGEQGLWVAIDKSNNSDIDIH
ncbi:MAG: hypothetical protein AB8B49_01120 [Nitratireductor sp.]